ncbi:hypothetical protein [Massilia varians]|uniref:hypothetical protein n=1 Tax=Massilia varians TaxID=457921 RepID=UPI0025567995|nr:hypothetical protein [Massilia varians]MDK6080368.1 hypothetical protein [Massilia varians]
MKTIYLTAILISSIVISGCTNEGGKLAKASGDFAQCTLEQGTQCSLQAPEGTTFDKASVAAMDDAIRVNAKLNEPGHCEAYARNAVGRWPGYIAQAVVNHTVVAAYGQPIPSEIGLKAACEMPPPYNVSLTVAKAP